MQAPPQSFLLPTVTALWREVLQGSDFSADTHFFLAGGDSLQLMRVLLKLQQACGVQLHLRDAAEFSTPRAMAAYCERRLVSGMRQHAAPLPDHHVQQYAPSPMQQGLWYAEQGADGIALYNCAALLHLQGPLEIPVLEQALSVLLHKHPVLRTTLVFDIGTRALRAKVAAFEPVFLRPELIDRRALQQAAQQIAARPFELQHRLYKFHLFRLDDRQHALLLCCHHAVSDGWSATVMLQSLAEAYNALRRDPAWQALMIDTAFFHHCESSAVAETGAGMELEWWRQQLSAVAAAKPPSSAADIPKWPYRLQSWRSTLPSSLALALETLARRHHVTPFSCLLATLKQVLADHQQQPEQTIGFPVAGRVSAAQEHSVGCYVNTLLTRDVVDGPGLCGALLRRVHARVQHALAHALPLQQLISRLRPASLPSGNAWFDVLFAFQNLPVPSLQFHGLAARLEALAPAFGQYPLKLEILPASGGVALSGEWELRVEYAGALFSESEIRAIVAALQRYPLELAANE